MVLQGNGCVVETPPGQDAGGCVPATLPEGMNDDCSDAAGGKAACNKQATECTQHYPALSEKYCTRTCEVANDDCPECFTCVDFAKYGGGVICIPVSDYEAMKASGL